MNLCDIILYQSKHVDTLVTVTKMYFKEVITWQILAVYQDEGELNHQNPGRINSI